MEPDQSISYKDRYRGLLLGSAVGDALGLPREGLSRTQAQRRFAGPLAHALVGRSGMVSDDTEHVIFVVQGLLSDPSSPKDYARTLGWSLRWWLLSLPAGVGWATVRAIFRLWLGFPPHRSGVYSAGNGPTMRAAPIGAYFAHDSLAMDAYLEVNTRITHTDPQALTGAKAIASLAASIFRNDFLVRPRPSQLINQLQAVGDDLVWLRAVAEIESACEDDISVLEFADRLGLANGVSGYVMDTVPVVVYAWYRHFGDFAGTVESVIVCGGDTDTAGSIVGALAGATAGGEGIPKAWVNGVRDWPRGIQLLEKLAIELANKQKGLKFGPVGYCWPAIPLRNVFFLFVVLLHGFYRLRGHQNRLHFYTQ